MAFMQTDWGPLLAYYALIAGITFLLGMINPGLPRIWLGANLLFLGFVVWLERPFIPLVRRNHYLAILVSTITIFLGILVSVIPCLR